MTGLDTLTAVILSWGSPELALRSSGALVGDGLPPGRLVVIDNESTDESAGRLRDELPGSVVLPLDENVGFGRANNLAARELEGDAYLFLNNDAFLHERGSLLRLLAALAEPGVGVVVPRVLNPGLSLQPTVAPIQSPAVALVRASGLSRLVPNRWQPRWSTHWDHARAREIQAAIAPVVLVRREAWDDLGGFTEETFMYAEDLDLCWRARRRGWRVWFAADAVFVHVGNASGRAQWQSEARRSERVGQAEAAMMRRHLSRPSAALALALLAGGLLARALVFRLAGDRERAAVLRAAARGYLGR